MVSRCRRRPLLLVLAVLALNLVPLSSLTVQACINPPSTCTTPDFEISMEAPDAVVNQGNQPLALAIIYVFSNAYYSGNVNLNLTTAPNLDNGPTLVLDHSVLSFIPSLFRDSGIEISAGLNTPLGNYTVTVTGSGGNVTHTTSFVLTVAPPIPPDDFTIALYPIPTQFQPGGHSDMTIQVFRKGPAQMVPIDLTVILNLTITPAVGLVASGFPRSAYIGAYDGIGTTFTIQSSSTTPAGVYTLNATGTNYQRSQSLSHSAIVTLTVMGSSSKAPPPPALPRSNSSAGNGVRTVNQLFSTLAAIIEQPLFQAIAIVALVSTVISVATIVALIGRRRS